MSFVLLLLSQFSITMWFFVSLSIANLNCTLAFNSLIYLPFTSLSPNWFAQPPFTLYLCFLALRPNASWLKWTLNETESGPTSLWGKSFPSPCSSSICASLFSMFRFTNSSHLIIFRDTSAVKDSIWSRMYSRKASLDQWLCRWWWQCYLLPTRFFLEPIITYTRCMSISLY